MQTLPLSLTLASTCHPFPHPFRWVCVCVCARTYIQCMDLTALHLLVFLNLCPGQPLTLIESHWELRAVDTLSFATWMRSAELQVVDICVSGTPKKLPTLYDKAGVEKWFPVGLWGLFLSSTLSGVLSGQGISLFWLTPEERASLRGYRNVQCVRVVPRLCD